MPPASRIIFIMFNAHHSTPAPAWYIPSAVAASFSRFHRATSSSIASASAISCCIDSPGHFQSATMASKFRRSPLSSAFILTAFNSASLFQTDVQIVACLRQIVQHVAQFQRKASGLMPCDSYSCLRIICANFTRFTGQPQRRFYQRHYSMAAAYNLHILV